MAVSGVRPVSSREFERIQLESYSIIEDSTPVDPSDTTGGVGQMTLVSGLNDDSLFLLDVPVDFTDQSQGTTRGTIRGLSTNNDTLTLVADSRLALLSVDRQAAPFVGTLEAAFVYYLSLVGITGGLVVDDAIATRPVIFPGWFGDAWLQMKKMAVSVGAEVSLVSNNVVLRPVRQRLAENYRDSNRALALDTGNLAQAVEIYYYNHEYHESKIAYPSGGWSPEVKIYTLDAGETIEDEIQIDASLMSLDQPVCVDWVDRYHVASSVYSVAGAGSGSSLPIPPAQWTDSGGSLTVEIGEDTRSIRLKITASTDTQYAPYQIAMTAGPSDQYSSLRLVGRGVFFDRQLLTLHTNVNPDRVSQEVGATVDNEFINTLDDAFTVGAWAVSKWGVPRRTITVNSSGINRLGDTGNYRYPTIKDWNELYAGKTIGQWNGLWTGQKVGAVNTLMREMTANDFDNQAFGNIGGARVHLDDAYYRIRNATVTQDGIGYTAEADTTIRDLNAVWGGKTIAQWNEQWAESRLLDQALAPLRKD